MAESLEGWAAHQRHSRPRRHRDRGRGVALALSLLLFAVVVGLSAVFLNRASAEAPAEMDANLVSGCYLMYPDDTARAQECINSHIP